MSTPLGVPTRPGSERPDPVVIDASVWVSWFLDADVNHLAAETWLDNHTLSGGVLVAPAILLTEVASAIARKMQSENEGQRAAVYLGQFSLLTLVPVTNDLVEKATYLAARYFLRAADAYYVAVANELALPLVTFDAEQLDRPKLITTIKP